MQGCTTALGGVEGEFGVPYEDRRLRITEDRTAPTFRGVVVEDAFDRAGLASVVEERSTIQNRRPIRLQRASGEVEGRTRAARDAAARTAPVSDERAVHEGRRIHFLDVQAAPLAEGGDVASDEAVGELDRSGGAVNASTRPVRAAPLEGAVQEPGSRLQVVDVPSTASGLSSVLPLPWSPARFS